MNKKEKIQSRREFFKKAAKTSLPILAAALLASTPIITKATETPMGCEHSCYGLCQNSCGRNDCEGHCKGTCRGSCEGQCGGCTGCTGTCEGSCKYTCRGNNKN